MSVMFVLNILIKSGTQSYKLLEPIFPDITYESLVNLTLSNDAELSSS
jgi:hypothetical protein